MRKQQKLGKYDLFDKVNVVIMVIMMIVMIYPLWYTVVGAFNDGYDYMRGGVYFLPRVFTLDNFKAVFFDDTILHAFLITILKCVIGTVTSVLFTAWVSYGLTRSNLIGRKFYLALMMFTMYFSGGMIPTFILIKNLGLYDSFWVYIIPSLFSVWNMVIMQSFMRELPPALIEAAKIDGASEYRIFFSIVLPLCKPVLAAVALFTVVNHWNSYFDAMLYTNSQDLQTIQLFLNKVITDPSVSNSLGSAAATNIPEAARTITSQSIKFAAMVVTALPVVVVYPFLQKYFVKGMTIGAVK